MLVVFRPGESKLEEADASNLDFEALQGLVGGQPWAVPAKDGAGLDALDAWASREAEGRAHLANRVGSGVLAALGFRVPYHRGCVLNGVLVLAGREVGADDGGRPPVLRGLTPEQRARIEKGYVEYTQQVEAGNASYARRMAHDDGGSAAPPAPGAPLEAPEEPALPSEGPEKPVPPLGE